MQITIVMAEKSLMGDKKKKLAVRIKKNGPRTSLESGNRGFLEYSPKFLGYPLALLVPSTIPR